MITIGILTTKAHDQCKFEHHYTKLPILKNNTDYNLKFRIRETLKSNLYYDKYVIDILKIDDVEVNGKSLLNIEKDTLNKKNGVDQVFLVSTQFNALPIPLNPYQFDYKSYLKKQYIYHQITVSKGNLFNVSPIKYTLFGFADGIRDKIKRNLNKYPLEKNELSIINALLLGQRQDISDDVYENYTRAGVIHILAVSGLHIGIILLLLQYLLKPLNYLRNGKLLKVVLIIGILWSYAVIAGLSASVVRAVTMFTLIAIGMNLKRPTSIYNTLFFSMFLLLLFKPMFIFDVGFQLSYVAVLSIVYFQPLLFRLWSPKFRCIKFYWNILSVTIAAQIGVLPLSIYYFHQFPGLFFISNLVIIPFLGFILGFGILVIILSYFERLPNFLAEIYASIIDALNSFVEWIAKFENFILSNISLSFVQMILIYALIISAAWYSSSKNYKSIVTGLFAILILQGNSFLNNKVIHKKQFIVFHKNRNTVIGMRDLNAIKLDHNLKDITKENIVTNFTIGAQTTLQATDSLMSLYQFDNKLLLVVDSIGIYNLKTIKPDLVLLINSPKTNLNRLIDSVRPEFIISDGSNYKSYRERWRKTCESKGVPYYETNIQGAFIYEY